MEGVLRGVCEAADPGQLLLSAEDTRATSLSITLSRESMGFKRRAVPVALAAATASAFLTQSSITVGPHSGAWRSSAFSSISARRSRYDASHGVQRVLPDERSLYRRQRTACRICMLDTASMDPLIDDLKAAPDSDTLTLKVSKSVKQVAQTAFFLRLAERAESAADEKQKAAFEKLATEVTNALERLVEFAEEKMDDSSSLLQIVVTSAAEKNGEFLVPLSEERLEALRQSIRIHRDQLDNNFLATVQSWMEKCNKEEEKDMQGMVVILQKILQVYAAEAILQGQGGGDGDAAGTESSDDGRAASPVKRTPARLLLEQVLETDSDRWDGILRNVAVPGQGMTGGVTKDGLLGAVQVAVETVVLQEENGSMAQRVQAEFLSELCKRIEAAAPEAPPRILE